MNWLKNLLRLPAFISSGLTFFISYVFLFTFMPYNYPEGAFTNFWSALTVIVFSYFSTMTQVFLWMTFCSDPGYLPDRLKREKVNNAAPIREIRLFQAEHY